MFGWFKTQKKLLSYTRELLSTNEALTHALAMTFQELQELRFESLASIAAIVAKYGDNGKVEIDHALVDGLVDSGISVQLNTDQEKRIFELTKDSEEKETND